MLDATRSVGRPMIGSSSLFAARAAHLRLERGERNLTLKSVERIAQRIGIDLLDTELGVKNTLTPPRDAKPEPLTILLAPPSGNFVSTQYESDCARFVSEGKGSHAAAHRLPSITHRWACSAL